MYDHDSYIYVLTCTYIYTVLYRYCIVSNSSILAHCAIYLLPRSSSLPARRWPRLSSIPPSFPVTYNIIMIHIGTYMMYPRASFTLSLDLTSCNQSESGSKKSYPTDLTISPYLKFTYHNVLHLLLKHFFLFPTWVRMAKSSCVFCCSGNYLHPTKSYYEFPKEIK